VPDHATIARFRARHEQALAGTFVQVLALCAKAGLVSVGVVALDGSLLAGNASPEATRSYGSICAEVERILAEAAQADAAEDERLGEARGDELPAAFADPRSRRERLRRCKSSWSRSRPQKRLPTRRFSSGAPPGKRNTGGAWRAASRSRPIPPRLPRASSTRPIPTRG